MLIDSEKLIEYCKKTAKTHSDLLQKSLNNSKAITNDFNAIAWFMQREEIYKYTLPNIINNFIEEMEDK